MPCISSDRDRGYEVENISHGVEKTEIVDQLIQNGMKKRKRRRSSYHTFIKRDEKVYKGSIHEYLFFLKYIKGVFTNICFS